MTAAARVAVLGLRVMTGDQATPKARRLVERNTDRLSIAVCQAIAEAVTSSTEVEILEALARDGVSTSDVAADLAVRAGVTAYVNAPEDDGERFAALVYALGVAFVHVEHVQGRATVSA